MKLFHVFVLLTIVGLTSGCATIEHVNRVEASAAQAQQAANAASAKADRALQAAEEARACCQQNSEKIDRAFKKSMQK
ncbi:MAG: alanine-zipper protein [Mariprofundaceae bacterium]